ncbi:MAG: flagellar hook-basal body complex protein FliE [Desulfonatronovibrionaceae bacterium]
MSTITPAAMKAYTNALSLGQEKSGLQAEQLQDQAQAEKAFSETIKDSLSQVNERQLEGGEKIKAFASGENQNVHELMITLQKAGLAMKMTSAVRNKAMEAYKELMQIRL